MTFCDSFRQLPVKFFAGSTSVYMMSVKKVFPLFQVDMEPFIKKSWVLSKPLTVLLLTVGVKVEDVIAGNWSGTDRELSSTARNLSKQLHFAMRSACMVC